MKGNMFVAIFKICITTTIVVAFDPSSYLLPRNETNETVIKYCDSSCNMPCVYIKPHHFCQDLAELCDMNMRMKLGHLPFLDLTPPCSPKFYDNNGTCCLHGSDTPLEFLKKRCLHDWDCEEFNAFCNTSILYTYERSDGSSSVNGFCETRESYLTVEGTQCQHHIDCVGVWHNGDFQNSVAYCDTSGKRFGYCKIHKFSHQPCHKTAYPTQPKLYCNTSDKSYCEITVKKMGIDTKSDRIYCGHENVCCQDNVLVAECKGSCKTTSDCGDGFCSEGSCCIRIPKKTALFCNDYYFPKQGINGFCFSNHVYLSKQEDWWINNHNIECYSRQDCPENQLCHLGNKRRCIRPYFRCIKKCNANGSCDGNLFCVEGRCCDTDVTLLSFLGDLPQPGIKIQHTGGDFITQSIQKCTTKRDCTMNADNILCLKINGTGVCLYDPYRVKGRYNRNLHLLYSKFFIDVSLNLSAISFTISLVIVIVHQIYMSANIIDITTYLLEI